MKANQFLHFNVEGYNTKTAMQLVKLHRSVNWIKNEIEPSQKFGQQWQ